STAGRPFRCVAFAPDGKTVTSGSFSRVVEEWDVATGKQVRTFAGHTSSVMSLAISPDGRFLLTGPSKGDGVRLWDRASAKVLHSLPGHGAQVIGVAFSPDGKRLATACYDGAVRVWDAASGARLHELRGKASKAVGVVFA